jgi:ankyrin repeat protein
MLFYAAFKHRKYETVELLCSEKCFNIYHENHRDWIRNLFFDAVVQGHGVAFKHFIKLWPQSLESALVGAAAGGHIETVELLIRERADINAAGPEDMFCEHDTAWVERLIRPSWKDWRQMEEDLAIAHHMARSDIKEDFRLWLTPIAWAAANGHLGIIQLLVQHNVQINIRDQSGFTPLCWAANQGRLAVVSYILDILPADQSQHLALEALEVAGARDQSEVIKRLWKFLSPKPTPTPENARWLIQAATACQDTSLLSQLLDDHYGDHYHIYDPADSAFSVAIEKHNIEILKLLLERLTYENEIVPGLLVEAVKMKEKAIVSHLLGCMNAMDLDPNILAHATSDEPIFRELSSVGIDRVVLQQFTKRWIVEGLTYVVEELLADPGFQLEQYLDEPILDCAIQGGREMFEFLLNQHQWDEQLSHNGPHSGMAIQIAVAVGDVDLLQLFFERGFPYTSEHNLILLATRTVRNSSALEQIIDFLLKRKPTALCELNSEGKSVLFQLMSSEKHVVYPDAVKLLLDRGADPLQQNQDGDTPLRETAKNGQQMQSFWLMEKFLKRRDDWHIQRKIVACQKETMNKNAAEYIKKVGSH